MSCKDGRLEKDDKFDAFNGREKLNLKKKEKCNI